MLGLGSELSGGIHLRLSLGLSGWLLDRGVIDLELLDLLSDLVDSGILLSGDRDLAFGDSDHVGFQGLLSDGRGLSRGRVDCLAFFDLLSSDVLVLHIGFAFGLGLGGVGGWALDHGAIV